MFRRFLKFFKGDEPGVEERFEGSYLDHLLEQARPFMVKQLEQCPDHDPILLAVVGVLRGTMLNAWAPEMRSPLTDRHTPGLAPPPPPGSQPEDDTSDPLDETLDRLALDLTEDGSEGDGDVSPDDSEDISVEDDTTDSADDEDVVEESEVEGHRTRITEEIDVTELAAFTEAPDRVEKDNTVEMDRTKVATGELPRVDTPDVLQAGRVFLNLLIDNDRLPTDLQLSVGETALARDLLLGYFVGNDDYDGKARRLISLVEKKFADGLFSQAKLLLTLFHIDESTRITNDRNLFYEDMILRLGIRRRHKLTDEETAQFKEKVKALSAEKGHKDFFAWLDTRILVKMHLLGRSDAHVHSWQQAISACSRDAAKEIFTASIPPVRWRPVDKQDATVAHQLRAHMSAEAARSYVISQIRTCYFVLRAVGDTGLEGYLDSFFDWTQKEFDLNGTRLMPILYNRSMMESASMSEILDDVYDEFFDAHTQARFEALDAAATEAAYKKAMEKLSKYDFGEVAPGYYDLAGFVFDEIFGMTYPSREFAAKVHRIT